MPLANHVSWKGYNDQWNQYAGLNGFPGDKYQLNYGTVGPNSDQYCNICNGFQYQTQIMTDSTLRTEHLKDTTDVYSDMAEGRLPAVSFVKPSGWVDGHPASSKWNSSGLASTATTDEGGGYYDSGYIQTLNYFGDGTRIPLTSLFEAPVLTSGLSRAALYFRPCAHAVLLVTAYSLSGGLRNHFTHSKS